MKLLLENWKKYMNEELPDYAREMMSAIGNMQGDTATLLRKAAPGIPDIQKVIEKYPEAADMGFRQAAINYNDGPYREEMNLKDAYESLLYGFSEALEGRRNYSPKEGEPEYIPAIDQKLSNELYDKWEKSTGVADWPMNKTK